MNIKTKVQINTGKSVALIFAMAPFFQHYVIPGTSITLEFALVLLFGGAYFVLSMLESRSRDSRSLGMPMLLTMAAYVLGNQILGPGKTINNGFLTSVAPVFSWFFILLITMIVFYSPYLREQYYQMTVNIAVIMTFVVIIQCVVFYGFGNTISENRSFLFPFQKYFTTDTQEYIDTSFMVYDGLFRPSAFFLEPAHFSQFCTIGLTYSLWKGNTMRNWKAIFISVGIVLTTSGIGIACVVFLWGLFILINREGFSQKTIWRFSLGGAIIVFTFFFLFSVSTSFQSSMKRIFFSSSSHVSAIDGRLANASLLKTLNTRQLLFGMGFKNIPINNINHQTYYLTGIIELLYCQGIFGTSLFLVLYIVSIVRAYSNKEILAVYILIEFIPFLIVSSNVAMLTLIQYIPFIYLDKRIKLTKNYNINIC